MCAVMTTTLEILRRVRKRLENPEAWTQLWFARGARGRKCRANDVRATSWCLAGAFFAEGVCDKGTIEHLLGQSFNDLVWWNDHTATHEMVIERLDRAIAAEEGK